MKVQISYSKKVNRKHAMSYNVNASFFQVQLMFKFSANIKTHNTYIAK